MLHSITIIFRNYQKKKKKDEYQSQKTKTEIGYIIIRIT